MHTLFEPRLVNDAFGDPGLDVDFRDERRALLFDLGDISTLPPRKLMRLSHVFVIHTHMDHFAGFDHLLRVVLGRKTDVVLFGGPDFIAQVEHKLRAYTWNLVDRYEVDLVIDVCEIGTNGRGQRARFSSRTRFVREPLASFELHEDVLHEETTFRVRGRFVDHGIACLAFAIEEKARLKVDKGRLVDLGFGTGVWLRELKHAVLTGAAGETPIDVRWHDRHGTHAMTRSVSELRPLILDVVPGRRIGYVTDPRYNELKPPDGAAGGPDRAAGRRQGSRTVPLFAALRTTVGGSDRRSAGSLVRFVAVRPRQEVATRAAWSSASRSTRSRGRIRRNLWLQPWFKPVASRVRYFGRFGSRIHCEECPYGHIAVFPCSRRIGIHWRQSFTTR